MKIRLQKFMAKAGIASRRDSEKLILEGKVKVNKKIVTELGVKVNPKTDIVEVNGERCVMNDDFIYIKLNKPKGVLSTVEDPFDRPTVMDLLSNINTRIYPVGRLDKDSEGLLILTNDGQATYKLTHPKYEIVKTYETWVKGVVCNDKITKLQKGVMLEDGMTYPAEVNKIMVKSCKTLLEIKIHEGRKRQVRRMCKSVGHPVIKLKRTRVGDIYLGSLRSGQWSYLTKEELDYIKNLPN